MKTIVYNPANWNRLKKKLEAAAFPPDKLRLVRKITARVQKDGDQALREFTLAFDGVKLNSFLVSAIEIRRVRKLLTPRLRSAFRRVERNMRAYYSPKLIRSWRQGRGDGLSWGEKITPIEKVGIYIPGGKASLVSTVFMTVVPALLARVPRIIMAIPPRRDGSINPYILAAADYLGRKEIYKIGGAQAIAALAFGTRSIPKVDKIVGPGNIYVTLAKKEVFGYVDIDSLAGPSEIAILADGRANARYIAADLLAQAEHGEGGLSVLISTSKRLIESVQEEVKLLNKQLGRKNILNQSIDKGLFLIKVRSMKDGIELVNRIAPEHLEIMTKEPTRILPRIKNAGAIFLGRYSPVAAGDYVAGPSHVLPTGRGARFFSPLSVSDFQKKSSVIRYNHRALKNDLPALQTLAKLEGLDAHALSARIRLKN